MKTLIIYEQIPERTQIALIDLTDEEYARFSKVHGYGVNIDEYDQEKYEIANAIHCGFCDNPIYSPYCDTDEEHAYFMKFADVIPQDGITNISGAERLIHLKFFL